jgi:hypothetical protein
MTTTSANRQPDAQDREPVHPSGTKPTIDDAESRMTSEGDITAMDESQAGRMGEGLRGERPIRHQPPEPGKGESLDQTAEPDGQFPNAPDTQDTERPGATQNRHGDRGGTS